MTETTTTRTATFADLVAKITRGRVLVETVAADSLFTRWNGYSRLPVSLESWNGERLPYTELDGSWTLTRRGSWERGAVDTLLPRG